MACGAVDEQDRDGRTRIGTYELSRRGYDQSTQPILRAPFPPIENLQNRNEEGEGLSTTRSSGPKDISALEGVRKTALLDIGHLHVRSLFET